MTSNLQKMIPVCAAMLLLGACGTRVTEREIIREQPIVREVPAPAPEPARVVIVQPPPVPVEEALPAPSATGYAWVRGHYVWRDDRWSWERGHWVAGAVRPMPPPYQEDQPSFAPRPGARWVSGYWDYVGNDWSWIRGHWE